MPPSSSDDTATTSVPPAPPAPAGPATPPPPADTPPAADASVDRTVRSDDEGEAQRVAEESYKANQASDASRPLTIDTDSET